MAGGDGGPGPRDAGGAVELTAFASQFNRAGVSASSDLSRILALPRRPPLDLGSPRARALVELMTGRLRRPDRRHDGSDCACASTGRRCILELLPAQAWALWEAGLCGGLLGHLAVGAGKTAVGLLAPLVLSGCRHAVLFVPPGLVGQLVAEYLAWREHWRVPSLVSGMDSWLAGPGAPVLRVVPYSRLSRPESTALLDELDVDTVIADEAHALRGRTAARTRRLLRLFLKRPNTRLLAWSGTVTGRSLKDFAHLSALSLCEGSPLPVDPDEVERWAAAVDPSDWPAPPGELRHLVRATGASGVRDAVRVRLTETLGFVSTADAVSCSASIRLRERRPPPAPPAVREALAEVRRTWVRPDGEELVEAVEVARVLREVACGFYYRWKFPGDPPAALLDEWFAARRDWRRELRYKLEASEPHLDSPFLCAAAAERAQSGYTGELPVWRSSTWARWADVKDRVEHETEAVWLDWWLARDAAAWGREVDGVVWYVHDAFGGAVAEASGLPLFSGGDADALREELRLRRGSVVLSLRAYGTGFDGLQRRYSRALVANSPSSGDAWEQGPLGRLHRQGQEADEVVVEVYRHESEVAGALDRAIAQAKFVEGVTGARQRLLMADVEWAIDGSSGGTAT